MLNKATKSTILNKMFPYFSTLTQHSAKVIPISLRTFCQGSKKVEEKLNLNKNKDEANPTGINEKIEEKGTKHIYKKKEGEIEAEIIKNEAQAYSESYDDGIFTRQRMSYVSYEISPKTKVSQPETKYSKTDKPESDNPKTDKKEETQTPEGNKKM
jgi:hypothetical protein